MITPADTDLRSIEALVAAATQAQDEPAALLALHTADAVVVNIAGRRVLGRDAFGQAMVAALASPLAEVRTTVEIVDVRLATQDVAVVSCTKTVHDGRSGDHPQVPTRGALTYLVARTNGRWLIAAAQTTPISAPLA